MAGLGNFFHYESIGDFAEIFDADLKFIEHVYHVYSNIDEVFGKYWDKAKTGDLKTIREIYEQLPATLRHFNEYRDNLDIMFSRLLKRYQEHTSAPTDLNLDIVGLATLFHLKLTHIKTGKETLLYLLGEEHYVTVDPDFLKPKADAANTKIVNAYAFVEHLLGQHARKNATGRTKKIKVFLEHYGLEFSSTESSFIKQRGKMHHQFMGHMSSLLYALGWSRNLPSLPEAKHSIHTKFAKQDFLSDSNNLQNVKFELVDLRFLIEQCKIYTNNINHEMNWSRIREPGSLWDSLFLLPQIEVPNALLKDKVVQALFRPLAAGPGTQKPKPKYTRIRCILADLLAQVALTPEMKEQIDLYYKNSVGWKHLSPYMELHLLLNILYSLDTSFQETPDEAELADVMIVMTGSAHTNRILPLLSRLLNDNQYNIEVLCHPGNSSIHYKSDTTQGFAISINTASLSVDTSFWNMLPAKCPAMHQYYAQVVNSPSPTTRVSRENFGLLRAMFRESRFTFDPLWYDLGQRQDGGDVALRNQTHTGGGGAVSKSQDCNAWVGLVSLLLIFKWLADY